MKNSFLLYVKIRTEHILLVKRSNKHKTPFESQFSFEGVITDILDVSVTSVGQIDG